MKRVCLSPKPASCDSFDIIIRPLFSKSTKEMPICAEIKPNVATHAKEYPLTLIVLADVSGSMLQGDKMHQGILRLGELASRFAAVKVDLIIIEFNDSARIICNSMPNAEELEAICTNLSPCGGTNIGSAIEMAMNEAKGKNAVHIALFTDGDDGCNLQGRMEKGNEVFIETMRTMPRMWMHCVGICDEFDNR